MRVYAFSVLAVLILAGAGYAGLSRIQEFDGRCLHHRFGPAGLAGAVEFLRFRGAGAEGRRQALASVFKTDLDYGRGP